MTREQRIVTAFVELADAAVDDFDVVEFLHRVAERSVTLLECSEAGLLLSEAGGALRVAACASERPEALYLLQSYCDEGPSYECVRKGRPILSEDLAADADRWPRFADAALSAGFKSVHAIPMRVRSETIGALNLFRAAPGATDSRDVAVGQGLAEIAAIVLLQERSRREARGLTAQLERALTSRVVIEQAKGIVAERAGVSVDTAFDRLRFYARSRNLRLSVVARDLVEGALARDHP